MHEHDEPRTTPDEPAVDSPQTNGSTPASGSVGDHVLDILSGVEAQFDRLRKVQQGHDAELTSLKEHALSLEKAEQEAREELARLREERAAVEQERAGYEAREAALREQAEAVETQRAEIERTRGEIERAKGEIEGAKSDLDARRRSIEKDAEALAADRAEQEQHQQEQLNELQGLEEELTRERSEHEAERQRIEKAHDDWRAQREQQDQALAERAADIEGREKTLQSESDRVRKLEGQVNERAALIEQQKQELESSRQTLEQQCSDSRQELEQIQAQLKEIESRSAEQVQAAETEAEASRETCEQARAEAEANEREAARLREQLEQSDARLTDAENKLALAGDRLSKFASILAEQAPQLEKGTAALAMVEHQREQIERLTKQVAEANVGGAVDELKRKDDRIVELTEALRQARGQAAGDQDVGELESRVAELLEEVEQLRVELEQSKTAESQAKKQLEDSVEQTVRENVSEAALAEQEAEKAALAAELEGVRRTLREQEKASKQADRERQEQVEMLTERVKELSGALREAKETPAAEGDETQATEAMAQLREKARRVNAVAEHLRRRQARLKKMRQLVESRERPVEPATSPAKSKQRIADMEERAEEIRQIENQRKELSEVRSMLLRSERTMMRKWARPRAASAVVWIFILVIINAAIAWFTTNQLFPAEIAASVALKPETRGGESMTADESAAWQKWHLDLVETTAFEEAVAKRMAERRLDQYRDAESVRRRIRDNLGIESAPDGSLTLSLSGRDRDEVTAVLDVVALTLSAESTRQMGKRNDRTRAAVQGERTEAGLIRYASVNAVPISDERMRYLGPVFGVLMIFSLLLVLGFYSHLIRAKKVFDEESALIDAGELVTEE